MPSSPPGVERFEFLQPASLAAVTRPVTDRAGLLRPGGRGCGLEVAPARRVQCPPPDCPQPGDLAFFFAGESRPVIEYTVGPQRVDALSDAVVIGPKAVVACGGRVFQETYWSDANLDDGVRFQRLRLKMQTSPAGPAVPLDAVVWRKPLEVPRWPEAAIFLAQPWSHNWHHWLLDSLPRLILLADWPEFAGLPVVTPASMTAEQGDSLRALGVDESRWRLLSDEAQEIETLILPQPGGFAPDVLQRLREALSVESEPGAHCIYVSRSDATTRRLANETEVLAALEPLGFRVLTLSGRSFAEQRAAFANAAIIVGPHGAGLTNSLFSPRGATVVELHPRDAANGCFRLTTAAWEQRHVFLTGPVVKPESRDFVVDPVAVRAAVEGCLTLLTP
jgi:hypothetical protein